MENKEGISFKNKLWLILREELCNGTTDCENSPECATEDGCQPDDLAVKLDSLFQQKLAEKKEELIQALPKEKFVIEENKSRKPNLINDYEVRREGFNLCHQETIKIINKVFDKEVRK